MVRRMERMNKQLDTTAIYLQYNTRDDYATIQADDYAIIQADDYAILNQTGIIIVSVVSTPYCIGQGGHISL